MQTNIETQRSNMIEQQIRPCNVLDQAVLEAFYQVHRENFITPNFQSFAFSDMRLPITKNINMLTPVLEGKILQSSKISKEDKILVVGTGSGYLSACVAKLGKSVVSLDINEQCTQMATEALEKANIRNIICLTADFKEWVKTNTEKYDLVIFTASFASLPEQELSKILKENSRAFTVLGKTPAMHACVVYYLGDIFYTEDLFETELEYLFGYEPEQQFQF